MDKAWMQFLLLVVPLLSLVGSWLALKTVTTRRGHERGEQKVNKS